MGLVAFRTETLPHFDGGRVAAALDMALQSALRDLEDRPADKKPRKIQLTIELSPETDAGGNLESVAVDVSVTAKVPSLRVRTNKLTPRRQAGQAVIVFNPDGNDARQGTLPIDDDE